MLCLRELLEISQKGRSEGKRAQGGGVTEYEQDRSMGLGIILVTLTVLVTGFLIHPLQEIANVGKADAIYRLSTEATKVHRLHPGGVTTGQMLVSLAITLSFSHLNPPGSLPCSQNHKKESWMNLGHCLRPSEVGLSIQNTLLEHLLYAWC